MEYWGHIYAEKVLPEFQIITGCVVFVFVFLNLAAQLREEGAEMGFVFDIAEITGIKKNAFSSSKIPPPIPFSRFGNAGRCRAGTIFSTGLPESRGPANLRICISRIGQWCGIRE